MNTSVGAAILATIVAALWPNAAVCQTSPSPAGAMSNASAATTAQSAASAPQPPPAGLLQEEALTGNWGGTRSRWKDKGLVLDSSLTQFYQGVSAGGTGRGSEYNATAQAKLEFDFGKLADATTSWTRSTRISSPAAGPNGSSTSRTSAHSPCYARSR